MSEKKASENKTRRTGKAKHELAPGHVDLRAGIGHIVKEIGDVSMTKIAKDELNAILNILGLKLFYCAVKFVVSNKMKTIKEEHIMGAIKILMPDGLISEDALKFMTPSKKQAQEIIKKTQIPSARVNKLIRTYAGGFRIGTHVPHILAHVLDSIARELITLSGNSARDDKKTRFTTRDLFKVIHEDRDLKHLIFKKLKITMAGSGVMVNIPQSYLPKEGQKGAGKINKINRKIKKQQDQSQCFNIAQTSFQRLVREHLSKHCDSTKISKEARVALQYFVEDQTVKLLRGANANALHVPRTILQKKDIDLELMKRKEMTYKNAKKTGGKSPVF